MKSVSVELAAAITSPDRVLVPRVTCDWDADGFNGRGTIDDLSRGIASLSVDQALVTNVPSVAQPVAGAAVAELSVDVEQGHLFGTPESPFIRNITSSTAATGTGVITLTRGVVKPGDIVLVWLARSGPQLYVHTSQMSTTWRQLFTRADYNSTFIRQTMGYAFVRRVGITQADADAEPSTYTFKISSSSAYVIHCIVIGGGYAPGIHAFTSKGLDPVTRQNTTYGLLQGQRITTTVPNCLIIGLFAGYVAPTGSGVTWTPDPPATEAADMCSASGRDNVATCVTQLTNAAAGSYTLGATISSSTEPGVVCTIAFAPMTAGDDTQNAAWTYSELNTASLLAGKIRSNRPVTASLDVLTSAGVQSVTLFTGRSLGVDVSSRARRATLIARDNRQLMRNDVTTLNFLGSAIVAEDPLTYPTEAEPRYPGLEATWLVSYIFSYCRQGQIDAYVSQGAHSGDGFFASPTIRRATYLHVPCHGSLTPFEGYTRYAYTQDSAGSKTRVTFGPGPWVASTSPAPLGGKVNARWGTTGASSPWNNDTTGHGATAGRIEVYLQRATTSVGEATIGVNDFTSPATIYCYLDLLASGVLQLRLGIDGGTTRSVTGPTVPNDGAWHAVGVHWDSTTGSATFRIDATATVVAFAAFTTGTLAQMTTAMGVATVTSGMRMAELQLTGVYSLAATTLRLLDVTDPFSWDNFTPTAFIDQSVNVMDSTLAVDAGTDCYGLLSELAEAEFAAVYFDSSGYPHYRTRYSDNTTAGQTVRRTLTTLNALKDLDYQSGNDQLANSVQVPYTPISFDLSAVVWQPSSPLRVPANTTSLEFIVQLPGLVDVAATNVLTAGLANTMPDGSGTTVSNYGIGTSANGSIGRVAVSNPNAFDIWLVDTSGNPSVSWQLTIVSSGTTTLTDALTDDESIRIYGPQTPINGIDENRWRQRPEVAEAIGRLLIADLSTPKPVLTNVKVVGDPRLELGDLVRFVDRDGLGLDGNYRLVGISPAYTPSEGFTQALVARRASCGVAIWDSSYWDDCSVWGT
jgi:hypothetical protein